MWWTNEIALSKCYCLIWIQRHACTSALVRFLRSGFNTAGDGNLLQWLFCEGSTTNESPTADQDKEANRGKQAYARALKRVIDSPAFTKADDERLGSHSIRKAAATKAREKGTPKDDIDYRARWAAKRMQDAYVSAQLLWPDVNCAR